MPRYRVVRRHYFTIQDEVIVEEDGSYPAMKEAENTDRYPMADVLPVYKRTSGVSAYRLEEEDA